MAPLIMMSTTLLPFVLMSVSAQYVVDDSVGLGRRFDGIGGLSGGGVSRPLCSVVSAGQEGSE